MTPSSHGRRVRRGEPSRAPRRSLSPHDLVFSDRVPSNTDAIEPVVRRVMDVMNHRPCSNGHCEAVELALREALANAIIHGNCSNSRKRVDVDCYRRRDDSIVLVIRDHGNGFDPGTVSDPTRPENVYRAGGRGIFLIRHFMDEVEFGLGGREIRMCKKLGSNHLPNSARTRKPTRKH